jgi:hypothetical protein
MRRQTQGKSGRQRRAPHLNAQPLPRRTQAAILPLPPPQNPASHSSSKLAAASLADPPSLKPDTKRRWPERLGEGGGGGTPAQHMPQSCTRKLPSSSSVPSTEGGGWGCHRAQNVGGSRSGAGITRQRLVVKINCGKGKKAALEVAV